MFVSCVGCVGPREGLITGPEASNRGVYVRVCVCVCVSDCVT